MLKKIALALALTVLAIPAFAADSPKQVMGAVEAKPSVVIYKPGMKGGVLALNNGATKERAFQITVFEVVVEGGKSVWKRSEDLRFAPSLITVPAQSTQTIRFAMKGDTSKEHFFRIIVQELPPVDYKPTHTGVLYLAKLTLAWFWRDDAAAPQLSARWEGADLLVKNTGTGTAQLSVLTAGSTVVPGLVGYVMPGSEERFKINAKAQVPSIALNVNGKPAKLDVH